MDLSRRGFFVGAAASSRGLLPLQYSFAQTKEIVAANIFNGRVYEALRPGLFCDEYIASFAAIPPQWQKLFAETAR